MAMHVAILAFSLMVQSSISPTVPLEPSFFSLPTKVKYERLKPYVVRATTCLILEVRKDPRHKTVSGRDFNELIVEMMKPCKAHVQQMLDNWDNYFGPGSGERFFMGPYLDLLPGAVKAKVE